MKRGTPRHPKVKRLARRLKIELHAAVGLLEMLWHFTAEFHPRGDVGRVDNPDIAEALDWPSKKADSLIAALVQEHFLDAAEECRLVVHDWPTHAEEGVHLKLARSLQFFADGSTPNFGRLSGKDRAKVEAFYANHCGPQMASNGVSAPLNGVSGPQMGQGLAGQGVLKVIETATTEEVSMRARTEAWRLDEGFCAFRDAYCEAGGPAIDADWAKAYFVWPKLDFSQKLLAVAHVRTCDGAHLKLPQNYLADHEWTRPPRPEPKNRRQAARDEI